MHLPKPVGIETELILIGKQILILLRIGLIIIQKFFYRSKAGRPAYKNHLLTSKDKQIIQKYYSIYSSLSEEQET